MIFNICVANTLFQERFGLVFKQGSSGKKVSQDALYVCQLLAINPEDLIQRDYQSFSDKGLSQKRQMLRYEHYEEKRQLKLKAIQNVLLKCQQKDGSGEALQVQALIEDLKRQKELSKHQGRATSYAPFGTQKYYSTPMLQEEQSVDRVSQYLDPQTAKHMERVVDKLDKWTRIKDLNDKSQVIKQKERKKFEKIQQNQRDHLEEVKAKIEYQQQKWRNKIQIIREQEKKEELIKFQKGREIVQETQQFFQTRRQREQTLFEKISRPELHVSQLNLSSRNDLESSSVELELEKLNVRLERARERNEQRKLGIVSRGQNKSQVVEQRRNQQVLRVEQRQQEMLSKSVNKAKRIKQKQEMTEQDQSLQAQHYLALQRQKELKLKQQQEEEKRNLKEMIKNMENKESIKDKLIREKELERQEQIEAKKEKRRLQFEDKLENERRLKMIQQTMKQQIVEKQLYKQGKIEEMRNQWKLNQSLLGIELSKSRI